jgi:hypothetical protein
MSYNPSNPNGSATSANSSPVVSASDDANLKGFANSSGGGYVRQDSTGTIAKETGGNLAAAKADLDSISTNTGNSATSANQTNGSQQTKLTNGTNIADVVGGDVGFNSVPTTAGGKTIPFTTSATGAQILLANTPVEGFSYITLNFTSVGTGISFSGQFCPTSGGTYAGVNGNLWFNSTGVSTGLAGTAGIHFTTAAINNFFQLNITAMTGGTTAGSITLSNRAPDHLPVSQIGTWTINSSTATGSAFPANAFYIGVSDGTDLRGALQASTAATTTGTGLIGTGVLGFDGTNFQLISESLLANDGLSGNLKGMSVMAGTYVSNGSNWDRLREANTSAGTTGTGLLGAGVLGYDGTDWQYAGIDANHNFKVATTDYPTSTSANATPITASSGNVANANAVATLAAVSGKTTYITGFEITSSGATTGLVVNATVTGTITGSLTYNYAAPAGALVMGTPLFVSFEKPIPASSTNTPIVVTLPALGLGNTNAAVNAHGYQL